MSTTEPAGPLVPRESLPPKLGAIASGKRVAAIVPETMDDVYRLSKAIASSGIAPRGYTKGRGAAKEADPDAIMVGIMHGLEVGLTPMAALQSIAVINGMPTIWGDGAIGLVYASGEVEDIEEAFEGKPYDDDFAAVCRIWRKGRKRPTESRFSVDDAKRAGLWQDSATKRGQVWKNNALVWTDDAPNDSPWYRYPKRMLQMRARSWALRDSCADILRGLSIREEVEDIPRGEPQAEPPMTARQAAVAAAPPPEEPPLAIAARGGNGADGGPIAGDDPDRGGHIADDAVFVDDAPPPEDPPEDAPPAVAKVEIDDVAFVRNIEAELRKLAVGEDDLLAKFEAICTAAEGRMEGMIPPDAGALSDLLERYRRELDL